MTDGNEQWPPGLPPPGALPQFPWNQEQAPATVMQAPGFSFSFVENPMPLESKSYFECLGDSADDQSDCDPSEAPDGPKCDSACFCGSRDFPEVNIKPCKSRRQKRMRRFAKWKKMRAEENSV